MATNSPLLTHLKKFLLECTSFDRCLKKVNIISIGNGNCTAELIIEEEHVNALQKLHSGLSAMLIDDITSMALLSHDDYSAVSSVSVTLNVIDVKEALIGDVIFIEAHTVIVGETSAYIECEIKNKTTGEVLVKGGQTKYLIYARA